MSDERNKDQCCRRAARRQPQHPAQLGAPLRLSEAPAHGGRAPPVRARRARGAAPRAARDAQHLLGDRGRPPARRGPELTEPPDRRLRPLRRGLRRPRARGEPRRALGRPHRGGGAASRHRDGRGRATAARPSGSWRAAGPPDGCTPPAGSSPPRRARRASCCSTPPSASTTSRCTCRRSSLRSAARAFARSCSPPIFRPSARRAPCARRPDRLRLLRRESTLDVLGRLVYTVRQVGSAAPVFEYREAMPVTGDHAIPSLGTMPTEAVDRLKAYVDTGHLEQIVPAVSLAAGLGPRWQRLASRGDDAARARRPARPSGAAGAPACGDLRAAGARGRSRARGRVGRRLLGPRGAHHRRRHGRAARLAPPAQLVEGKRHRGHADARGARARAAAPADDRPPRRRRRPHPGGPRAGGAALPGSLRPRTRPPSPRSTRRRSAPSPRSAASSPPSPAPDRS